MSDDIDDATFKAQQKRVKKGIRDWKPHLIDNYEIISFFHRGEYKDREGDVFLDAVASVKPDARYIRAVIDWNLGQVAKLSDDELQSVVVHELCHILLAELTVIGKERAGNERSATKLERVVLGLVERGRRVGATKSLKAKA